jgi:hypothetical protein
LRGENFVNAAVKSDRVLSRHDQNRLPKALELIHITLQLCDCCKAPKSRSSRHPFLPTLTTYLRFLQTAVPEQTTETDQLLISRLDPRT